MSTPRLRYLSDIACFSYSPEEIRRCIRKEDFWRYELNVDTVETIAKDCSTSFYSSSCTAGVLDRSKVGGKYIFRVATICDVLCLRRTDQILRRTLRTVPANRDDEVEQLVSVLQSERGRKVFKADIAGFFESVDFCKLIDKVEIEGLRNNSTISYLRSLNKQLIDRFDYRGLPRGLSISSTLADYFLHDFDQASLNIDGAIYCCRYVDDICVVHHSDSLKIEKCIEGLLPGGLKLNPRKTVHVEDRGIEKFSFLGYLINLDKGITREIAPSKIGKVKKRLILSLREFVVTRDFSLLYLRLLFLSSTIRMEIAGRSTPVYSGFRHVYRHCTPRLITRQMVELDGFLQAQLTSQRFWLSRMTRSILKPTQLQTLRRVSFFRSYKERVTYPLSRDRVSRVKGAWKYE